MANPNLIHALDAYIWNEVGRRLSFEAKDGQEFTKEQMDELSRVHAEVIEEYKHK